jgi:hypothetical protein
MCCSQAKRAFFWVIFFWEGRSLLGLLATIWVVFWWMSLHHAAGQRGVRVAGLDRRLSRGRCFGEERGM